MTYILKYQCSQPIAVGLLTLAALLPAIARAQTHGCSAYSPTAPVPKWPGATTTRAGRIPTPHARLSTTKPHRVNGNAVLPLAFEPNFGQVDKRVRFLTHTAHGTLFLTDTEAVLTLPVAKPNTRPRETNGCRYPKQQMNLDKPAPREFAVLRMRLIGAHAPAAIAGINRLPGIVNYFRGKDPRKWRTRVPTFRQAKFAGIYKGVDMLYYGARNGMLEYDFVVSPGADPKAITLAFSGATGARVTSEGDLALQTAAGEVRWQRPVTYQMIGGLREAVACAYELKHQEGAQARVGFRLARYDRLHPVIIDPTLIYSTYLGGSLYDSGNGIAVDSSGNSYVTGYTDSFDFPTTQGALQASLGGPNNAFVTKLSPDGSSLVYSTYLGGSSYDAGVAIAVDGSDHAYVTGDAESSDFPTTQGAFQATLNGYQNAFVTKLSADGSSLVYSTYLGGSGSQSTGLGDSGNGIAVNSSGNAYVTGSTASPDFPTTPGAFQTINNDLAYGNAFVTKLSADGSSLEYSSYLGGSGEDSGNGIALDDSGSAYATGYTYSPDFPITPGAFQTTNNDANHGNVFVTKLSLTGTALIYSTYLGGTSGDYGDGIAVDSRGSAYVTGGTYSADFPITQGAFQTKNNDVIGGNAFVTKLNATGSALAYSTYLGGSSSDEGNGIAVNGNGNAYVTGVAFSYDFPTTAGAFQTTLNGTYDAFVTTVSADGSALAYSTYLGGSGDHGNGDYGTGIVVDSSGNAYVTGIVRSSDFPITFGAFQTTNKAFSDQGSNAFVARFDEISPAVALIGITVTPSSFPGGQNAIGEVFLNTEATSNVVVALNSSASYLTLPKTVAVPKGLRSERFEIHTQGVNTLSHVAINASYHLKTVTTSVVLKPITLTSASFSPDQMEGGLTTTLTLKLNSAAPSGGFRVALKSSDQAHVPVPTYVTIPEGESSISGPISTGLVNTTENVTVTATANGVSAVADLLLLTP